MRLLLLLACGVMLVGCRQSETQKLAQSLRDGSKDPNKGIVIIGMSFRDGFRPDDKNPLNVCLNLNEKPKDEMTPLKCDALIKVEDKEDGKSKRRMLRVIGVDRRKVSVDAFTYAYRDKEKSTTHLRTFYVDQPPSGMLANYGDVAYVGDFHFSVDGDIETEKPRLHIRFENDYAGFKQYMKEKGSDDDQAVSAIKGAVNMPLTGYATPVKLTTKDRDFTPVYTPSVIYVPKFSR